MAQLQKFLFDTEFDEFDLPPLPRPKASAEGEEAGLSEDQAEAEAESMTPEEELPPPVFSEEDMAAVRKEGLEEGRRKAAAEAQSSTETRKADILERIAGGLERLFAAQKSAADAAERNALQVAAAISAKMFPSLNRRNGQDEVKGVVSDILRGLREESRVTVRVSATDRDTVQEMVESIIARGDFEGRVTVVADETLPDGDCRLEWGSGSAERNMRDILAGIDDIIERNLFVDEGGPVAAPDPTAKDDDRSAETADAGMETDNQPDRETASPESPDDQAG